VLHVRVRMEGEYTGQGTLEVRGGGGIFCTVPNCTVTIEDFRSVSFHEGSVIGSDSLVIRVPRLLVGGTVEANRIRITAGALNVSSAGALVTGPTSTTSKSSALIRQTTPDRSAKLNYSQFLCR
jgi:hypothetical protein